MIRVCHIDDQRPGQGARNDNYEMWRTRIYNFHILILSLIKCCILSFNFI